MSEETTLPKKFLPELIAELKKSMPVPAEGAETQMVTTREIFERWAEFCPDDFSVADLFEALKEAGYSFKMVGLELFWIMPPA